MHSGGHTQKKETCQNFDEILNLMEKYILARTAIAQQTSFKFFKDECSIEIENSQPNLLKANYKFVN